MKDIPDKSIELIIADPPYNEGKADWDNNHDYIRWWHDRVDQFVRILKPNGVFYFFQMNIQRAMEMHHICKKSGLVLRQMITIDKGLPSVAGRTSVSIRTFPKATEYLFYYTFKDITGNEQLSDTYQQTNPMAKYLKEEIERAGVGQGKLRKLFPSKTEGETGCITNWVKGYSFPLKWQYEKIRSCLNQSGSTDFLCRDYEDLRGEYEDLRGEYEDLRREYEDSRHVFNLPYGVTDVWAFNFYEDKIAEHETPKPIKLIERIVKASSNPGAIVLDPFLGSGTTLLACRRTERIGIGFEINQKYEPLIQDRMLMRMSSLDSFDTDEEQDQLGDGQVTGYAWDGHEENVGGEKR